ncbi:MAG: apolipoprotein N-acyltransferase [Erythrobacter sp.]|jgi:apolipoprotein N-acyltransferase
MDMTLGFARRHPRWTSLVLGALVALGFPPLQLWPLALVGMGAFALLIADSPARKDAFLRGWLFGWAHFTVTDNWIATAFTYQAQMPVALGWVAVPLVSLYLAVYPAIAALLAHTIARRAPLPAFALAFGASWVLAEWLRSWVFTGYAWGPFSLALMGGWDRPGLGVLLPFSGTYALSGIAVALAGFGAWLVAARRWLPLGALAVALGAGMHWPAAQRDDGTLPLTLVQPNLKQEEIADPTKFEGQFQNLAQLSMPLAPLDRRLVLWPESGVPDYLREGYPQRYYNQMTAAGDPVFARRRIGSVLGRGGLLLTGVVDLEIGEVDGLRRAVGAYNTITPIDAEGRLGRRYAKAHLVPYGEYLPLRWLLAPLGASRFVAGSIEFIPGPGPQTFDLGDYGKAGMQVCYEIVFSGEVSERGNRPDYLFNPSNDGWFGAWGPPQHLGQARMRAVEEGLPVLRSTTTGISAVIDARGVVRNHVPRHVAGRIDTLVPPAAPPTWFARAGHWLTLGWGLLLLTFSLVAIRRAGGYLRS